MIENIELGVREAVARDSQYVVGFNGSVGHDRAKFDGLVAYAFGRRIVAEQGGDHVGDDADVDCRPTAISLEPKIEQAIVERGDGRRPFVYRRVRDHDVVVGNSTSGEEFRILPWRISRIADGQRADADVA